MSTFTFICRLIFWLCLAAAPAALGQVTTNFTFNNVNLAIPEDNLYGVGNSQTITGVPGSIMNIQLSLDIAGTGYGVFNGDLYAELVNTQGGFAVLLNRVGMSSATPDGYYDNGFDVTFSDAAAYDIHFYQNYPYVLNGGQLTGTWQPDGETINPENPDPSDYDNALENQTAMFSSFDGNSPNDTWTLSVADLSSGGTGQIVSWSLEITTIPEIPEPKGIGFIAAGFVLHGWFRRLLRHVEHR